LSSGQLHCSPSLDALLDRYFNDSGASIKSCLDITGSAGTDPTSSSREDTMAEVGKLMIGLTMDELFSLGNYYRKRHAGELETTKAHRTRSEARNTARGRSFQTAIKEVERKWNTKKRA